MEVTTIRHGSINGYVSQTSASLRAVRDDVRDDYRNLGSRATLIIKETIDNENK